MGSCDNDILANGKAAFVLPRFLVCSSRQAYNPAMSKSKAIPKKRMIPIVSVKATMKASVFGSNDMGVVLHEKIKGRLHLFRSADADQAERFGQHDLGGGHYPKTRHAHLRMRFVDHLAFGIK